jgi:hypothetical protein
MLLKGYVFVLLRDLHTVSKMQIMILQTALQFCISHSGDKLPTWGSFYASLLLTAGYICGDQEE